MKLNSFYDKKLPVSTKASSPMFVTNEVREQELMQQIRVLESKIKQYEEGIIEHDRMRGEAKSDRIERERVTRQLEETLDTIRVQETALEPLDKLKDENRDYKERINGLESLNKNLSGTLHQAQENSKDLNNDMGIIKKQNKVYQEKIEDWSIRVEEAESIAKKLRDMNERFDAARRDAEVKSSTVESQFKDMKNSIEQLDSERNFWKVSSQSYEDQLNELGRVDDQLRTWTLKLEDQLGEGQSNSKKDKSKITKLNKTIKEMVEVIGDLTDHNNYLIDFNTALKVELSKPKYVSTGSVQGEKFPLVRENIRTKQLGTGKPTLLKFRPKGDENDDN